MEVNVVIYINCKHQVLLPVIQIVQLPFTVNTLYRNWWILQDPS